MSERRIAGLGGAGLLLLLAAAPTRAEEPAVDGTAGPVEARMAELERKLEVLSEELERRRLERADVPLADRSVLGMGPAASKVYRAPKGVSVAGYGETVAHVYKKTREDGVASNKTNAWDQLRSILYVGYKFNDWIVFNSEMEFEHAHSSVRGEVSVEFAYVDFRPWEHLGARAGMLLIPVGLVNELHEPTLYPSASRPSVEGRLIPTTWRENGAGVFGEHGPVSYRAYVVNGFQAVKDSAVEGFGAGGIRDGRQQGSKGKADDVAGVARVDVTLPHGSVVGVSYYDGRAGHNAATPSGKPVDGHVTLREVHGTFQHRGLELAGLYVKGTVGNAGEINEANGLTGAQSVGEANEGWYLQAAYDVFSEMATTHALSPFVRYERYDTQQRVPPGFARDPARKVAELTAGIAYQPIPQVVVKADALFQHTRNNAGVDQYNVALGYVF